MTIREFIEDLPVGSQRDALMDTVSIWSNTSCMGYCVDAMRQAGFEEEAIESVLDCLYRSFDEKTVEEAEQIYLDL